MSNFKDILTALPSIDNLSRLELYTAQETPYTTIENIVGKSGSLKVYNSLYEEYGCINKQAAEKGLQLFAEHTGDARHNPGKHPNIDLLLLVIKDNLKLDVKVITK